MKQIFSTILILAIALVGNSQNFSSKISENATMVFTLNGNTILGKVSEKQLNESAVFNEFKKEFGNPDVSTLSDFGLDFTKSFVFAQEWDTSLNISIFFMPIKDEAKFAKLIPASYGSEVKKEKGYKILEKNGKKIAWNKEFAVFISGYYVGQKYRYRYSYNNEFLKSDYYTENRAIKQIIEEDSENTWGLQKQSDRMDEILGLSFKVSELDNHPEFPENFTKKEINEVKSEMNLTIGANQADPVKENVEVEFAEDVMIDEITEAIEAVSVEVEDEYNEDEYYKNESRKRELRSYRADKRNDYRNYLREKTERKKDILTQLLYDNRVSAVFNSKFNFKSITSNSSFTNSQDKKADATFWVRNEISNNALTASLLREMYGYRYSSMYRDLGVFSTSLNQMNSAYSVTKLFFEKDGIKFENNTENNEFQLNSTNNIYSTKQDSRFFDYVNGDNFLAYTSLSFDSKSLIEVMPQLYMDQYGRFAEDNQEEFQVMVDMISIFLDEKAIGELATGNAFFVLKDMDKKEVTYNSYEYDENYKSTLVEKTKTELLPEFLFMFSTSNEEMLTKIMGLGIKNEILIENNKYYTINSKKGDLPFDIFFVIKDGIVFISTDEIEIKTIVQGGKFENNLASRHQKLVSSNSQVIYINNQKITEYIPADFFSRRSQDEYAMYKEFGCEEIVVSSKNKNGNMETTGYVSTPNNEMNSALYFFNFINRMIELND